MPAPRLAGAHAAVPAGPASPAFPPPSLSLSPSLPAPVRIATGGSAGRLPPPIHLFPMTLAGLEQSEPAPAGSRTRLCARWGARGRARTGAAKLPTPLLHLPPSARGSAPRLAQGSWPTTNEKGNGPARPSRGPLLASTCGRRPALAPRGRGAFASPPASLRAAPPSCGPRPPPDDALIYAPHGVSVARPPVIEPQQWPADSPRPGRAGGGASIHAWSVGEGEGGVREFNNGPRA